MHRFTVETRTRVEDANVKVELEARRSFANHVVSYAPP